MILVQLFEANAERCKLALNAFRDIDVEKLRTVALEENEANERKLLETLVAQKHCVNHIRVGCIVRSFTYRNGELKSLQCFAVFENILMHQNLIVLEIQLQMYELREFQLTAFDLALVETFNARHSQHRHCGVDVR